MLDRQMTYKIISRSLISNYVEEEKLGAKLIICYPNSIKTLSKYFIPIQSFHGQSRRRNVNNILILWACSMHDYPSITTDQHRSFAFPLNEMVNDDLTLSDLSLSFFTWPNSFIHCGTDSRAATQRRNEFCLEIRGGENPFETFLPNSLRVKVFYSVDSKETLMLIWIMCNADLINPP